MQARELPYQHLSIRVPWHDTGWEGKVCADPISNSSCLCLKRIAEGRDDELEVQLAGQNWRDLKNEDLPPCSQERAGFMSKQQRMSQKIHPYSKSTEWYKQYLSTSYKVPKYAADCVPFRWMLRKNAVDIAEYFSLPYQQELEDEVDSQVGYKNQTWVQHGNNQRLLLDTFFSAVKSEHSLVFFYAKESPLSNDPRHILLGVGRVKSVGTAVAYKQHGNGTEAYIWERIVQHSIRPSMEDGFLLPYHDLLKVEEEGLDPADYAVFVPEALRDQFSYVTEHVTHDSALQMLLSIIKSVDAFSGLVSGKWDKVRGWLNDRMSEIWKARGPCPGLGAALCAFGIDQGVVMAHEAQAELKDNEDPWPLVDKWLRDPADLPESVHRVDKTLSKAWTSLSDERRLLLYLISRFDLTIKQAVRTYQETERRKSGIDLSDSELLQNPYLIYETNRLQLDPVAISVIDHGVFPADQIRETHPLPDPSAVEETVDPRRVRALIVDVLEGAVEEGDSLRSQDRVIQEIRDSPLDPGCPLSADIMRVCADALSPVVEAVKMASGEPAYQLERLQKAKDLISRQVKRRYKGKRLHVKANKAKWRRIIDELLDKEDSSSEDDKDEELARREKAAALEILAISRLSVLIGAAGTGKTTLLRALCKLPEVSDGGLLLLAPTGKARVRMQTEIGHEAKVLAGHLYKYGRYDTKTFRCHRSDTPKFKGARTVIVDECSMLTEEDLDALLDSLESVDRLVLVGDPRQLPPIGVGRPFVDIIEYLKDQNGTLGFPRVAPSYAELTILRRQVATSAGQERADLLLAEWFAGEDPSPGSEEVWNLLASGQEIDAISMRTWEKPEDLHEALREEICNHTEMEDPDDYLGFGESYGGVVKDEYLYFNLGSAFQSEAWQVLSPVRGREAGVVELNRMLQRSYRMSTLELARYPRYRRKISKPMGPQEIVYGDKVMNLRNRPRKNYYPKDDDCMEYVANGEIGLVTGPFRGKGRPKPPFGLLNVEFSTQPDVAYAFYASELDGEESSPILELAYAITIHKSQGSEFEKTFIVLPNPCRLLSRELLYTALTRQRNHIVLLCQGDFHDLRNFSNPVYSETATRLTNLFSDPAPVEVEERFLESRLIHHTRSGIAVRSKSEVIIADLLYSKDIDFDYERPLYSDDGSWRFPDFTIEDDTTGLTIYWEHLGMMQRPSYRQKWEQKLAWYREQGILPHDKGGGSAGVLLTTEDGEDGSISSEAIEALIDEVLG